MNNNININININNYIEKSNNIKKFKNFNFKVNYKANFLSEDFKDDTS